MSKNIIYTLIGQFLLLILGFVAVKYIFRQLGEDTLGIIYFTLTMNAVVYAALEMGICSTTVREVASHAHDEPEYIQNLIKTASLFYWSLYLILAIGLYLISPLLIEKWINLKTMDFETATYVLRILGVSSLTILPQRFYASILRGLQRMEFTNVIDVATMGLQQLGTIVILILGGNTFHVIYWFALNFSLSIIIYFITCAYFFSWRALIPTYSPSVVKRNAKYSFHMMAISMLSMIHIQSDKIILSKLLPIGAVAFYGFSYMLTMRASILTEAISQAAFPSFSELWQTKDQAGLMKQYRKLHDLVSIATIPLFAAIIFASLPLFTYIFNQEVANMLFWPLIFLCVGSYMHGTLTVPHYFSVAIGKTEIGVTSNTLALFIVLPVTGALIYYFGLTGAGLSWIFYHIFSYIYAIRRICRECLDIAPRKWYAHISRIITAASIIYGVAWAMITLLNTHSLVALTLGYVAASSVFLGIGYRMMTEELKTTLWAFVRPLRFILHRTPPSN